MRLRNLEVFHAVMQSGTVKGAAERLHLTQPAMSRLLQQAERQLGLVLFERRRGRLVPTAEALRLRPEVEQLDLQIDSIRRLADNLRRGPAGALRVLCAPSLADPWLTDALVTLRARHPAAPLTVRTLHSREIAASLALQGADVGFAFEAAEHPAVVSSVIARCEMVAVGPLRGREVTLEALAREPVIDLDPADPLGRLLHAARGQAGVQFDSTLLAHNYHTAVVLARRGLGVALVDAFTGRQALAARAGERALRCVPLRPSIPVAVHALRPVGAGAGSVGDALVTAMAASLAQGVEEPVHRRSLTPAPARRG